MSDLFSKSEGGRAGADSPLQLSLEPSWEKRGRGQLRGRTWSLTWTLAPGGTSLGYFTAHGIQGLRKVWKSGGGGGGSKSYVVGIICPPAQVEIIGSNDLPKTGGGREGMTPLPLSSDGFPGYMYVPCIVTRPVDATKIWVGKYYQSTTNVAVAVSQKRVDQSFVFPEYSAGKCPSCPSSSTGPLGYTACIWWWCPKYFLKMNSFFWILSFKYA